MMKKQLKLLRCLAGVWGVFVALAGGLAYAETDRQSFIMGDSCVQYTALQGFSRLPGSFVVTKYIPVHKGLQDNLAVHVCYAKAEGAEAGAAKEAVLLCSVDKLENASVSGIKFAFLKGYSKSNPGDVFSPERLLNNSNELMKALPHQNITIEKVVPGTIFHEDDTSFSFFMTQSGQDAAGKSIALGTVVSMLRAGERVVIVYQYRTLNASGELELLKKDALGVLQALHLAECVSDQKGQ